MQRKKNIIIFIAFSLLFALSGCNTTQTSKNTVGGHASYLADADEWQLMTGKWYGNQQMQGTANREWLVTRRNDGSYTIEFKTEEKNKNTERSIEVGEWGVSGGVYFTIFKGWKYGDNIKPATPQNQWTRNAYKIISLNEKEFVYSDLEDGDKFSVIRVPDDFELK